VNSRHREKHEARTCRFEKEKQKNRIAMRTVEFNQAMSGREGAQLPPLPPAPPNLAHTVPLRCSARHQHPKGDISIELTMGTFLSSLDIPPISS
jgi:hypothetical protein